MLFDNKNPFVGSKKVEDQLACYWYNQLWNKVISIFKWSGKEFEPGGSLNADYLEWCLLTSGNVGFFEKDKKVYNLLPARVGLDPYNFPITLQTANPVLGNLKGVIGINAVWGRNNKFAQPILSTIQYYAGLLGKLQCSLNVGINNNRMTKVFFAEDDLQANQLRKMQDDVSAGKDAVIVKTDSIKALLDETYGKSLPVYSTPSEYLTDKYLQAMREVISDFYMTFGIQVSGGNMIKKERLTVPEVDCNNQQIKINQDFYLEPRKQICAEVNKVFGLNIDVEVRLPSTEESPVKEEVTSDGIQ